MGIKYEYERYICTKETLDETISKFGVAIIPEVLNEIECENMINGIWDFIEHISQDFSIPINRYKTDTWKEYYKLLPSHSMLIQYFGVGHAQVSWDIRQNKKIVDIFSYFWKCKPEELLVSFDGLSFNLPHEITGRGWFKNNLWYHTDQSYLTTNFKCVQSWITGLDVNENDATLSFMESSNKYHCEFQKKYNITKKDNWYKLSKEELQFYEEKGCLYKNIMCPKGSLVLWDSRTIHCGIQPCKIRENPNCRAVIYLCYMPRILSDKKNLEKKKKAFEELRSTTHSPCSIKLFGKNPRKYNNNPLPKIKNIPKPTLNDLGKKLAGY